MKWLRKARTFVAMPPVSRRRTLEALASLLRIGLSLRLRGYVPTPRRLESALQRNRPRPEPGEPLAIAFALHWAVEVAAGNLPYAPRCLERSLALWWMLGRRGLEADLRIGVRRADAGLEAHAWVELLGHQINDGADVGERYAAFEGGISPGSAELR